MRSPDGVGGSPSGADTERIKGGQGGKPLHKSLFGIAQNEIVLLFLAITINQLTYYVIMAKIIRKGEWL